MDKRRDKDRDRDRDEKRPFRKRKKRPCLFCVEKSIIADYKNLDLIRRFMSDRGKIMTRRSSGCCAKHQRLIAKEIKKARMLGLVAYTVD